VTAYDPQGAVELISIRAALGMTQVAFAKRLGISQGALSQLENGKRRVTVALVLAARYLAIEGGVWVWPVDPDGGL
jgi:transcriptional regulator with XRE-family HTH domain